MKRGNELTDEELRMKWREWGGNFHGPNIETASMIEDRLFHFMRAQQDAAYEISIGIVGFAAVSNVPAVETFATRLKAIYDDLASIAARMNRYGDTAAASKAQAALNAVQVLQTEYAEVFAGLPWDWQPGDGFLNAPNG